MNTVRQLDSNNDILLVDIDLPEMAPTFVFGCWTTPELITQWWPKVAEIDARLGGHFQLGWPQLDQTLQGDYIVFELNQQIGFSWQWVHQLPRHPPLSVEVTFAEASGGTHLTLRHGSYSHCAADQELRLEHHLAGWAHFLPRLAQVKPITY